MLKGISPLISPELLMTLAQMGHGDEIIFADAHFPAHSLNAKVIRADGLKIADLLGAVLPLFELDAYVDHPLVMMSAVAGDQPDPVVENNYLQKIKLTNPGIQSIFRIGRFDYYERAKSAFAIVVTGETAKYGNILLKKGVSPVG